MPRHSRADFASFDSSPVASHRVVSKEHRRCRKVESVHLKAVRPLPRENGSDALRVKIADKDYSRSHSLCFSGSVCSRTVIESETGRNTRSLDREKLGDETKVGLVDIVGKATRRGEENKEKKNRERERERGRSAAAVSTASPRSRFFLLGQRSVGGIPRPSYSAGCCVANACLPVCTRSNTQVIRWFVGVRFTRSEKAVTRYTPLRRWLLSPGTE